MQYSHPGIVITRPEAQAQPLLRALQSQGATPYCFPTIVIESLQGTERFQSALAKLSRCQKVIALSANAITSLDGPVWSTLQSRLIGAVWFAVGRATQQALEARGIQQVVSPVAESSSEGLLALPELQSVAHESICLLKGEGGRDLLAQQLEQRQAKIYPLNSYRRQCPPTDPRLLLQHWRDGAIQWVIVTSKEGLDNFLTLIGPEGKTLLEQTGLIVNSKRLANYAKQTVTVATLLQADNANEKAICRTLSDWYNKKS